MREIIPEKNCRKVLSKINSTFILDSYEVKPLEQENIEGLIGNHFKLQIFYKNDNKTNNLQLFVKTLNKDSRTMYNLSVNLCVYEKEHLLYEKLLPDFEKIGINVNFAPRGYLCEDQAVIIEDLSLTHFKIIPKGKPLDLGHCQSCLKTLAQFHASSILYEVRKSIRLGVPYSLLTEYPDLLKDLLYCDGDNDGGNYSRKSLEGLVALAEIEFAGEANLGSFKNKLISCKFSNDSYSPALRYTVLHGDLRSNNFLYRYEGDELVESKLIDYQFLKYGPPELDLLLFIYINTTGKFRNDNFDHLLNSYHQFLEEILQESDLKIDDFLPQELFLKSCESLKLVVKIQALIDNCITCLPDEVFIEFMTHDEMYHNFIFEDRAKFLTEFYTTMPKYRKIISEDLRELKEMMCASK